MPWFAIDTELEDNPKFHAFIKRRGISAEKGVAFFYRFWRTVRLFAPRGIITAWTDAYVGQLTGVSKPAGILLELESCGFLDRFADRLEVHDWFTRNGKWIKDTRWHRICTTDNAPQSANDLPENVRPGSADRPPPRARACKQEQEHEHEHEQEASSKAQEPSQTGALAAAGSASLTQAGITSELISQFEREYPARDVADVAETLVAAWRAGRVSRPARALRSWLDQAEKLDTHRKQQPRGESSEAMEARWRREGTLR